MLVDVYNMEGKKVDSVELPGAVFEAPVYVDLMHQAFVRQMANARLGTHDTKVRGEVSGGGRKPWRQKGTGRARQGSIRAAQWKGGGRIHTPHPRKYTKAMPRKMRLAALRSALSVKAAEANVVMLDQLTLPEPKTRLMAKALDTLVGDCSALILIPEKEAYEGVIRAANNLPDAKIMLSGYLNIRDLLKYEKLVMPVASLESISNHLG
ncbi:MAG: 50S ribosomal protein L4 [Chloroflexi bacterium]|nr:50S ribosomal protein L4 [Chloroflexota bacterium]